LTRIPLNLLKKSRQGGFGGDPGGTPIADVTPSAFHDSAWWGTCRHEFGKGCIDPRFKRAGGLRGQGGEGGRWNPVSRRRGPEEPPFLSGQGRELAGTLVGFHVPSLNSRAPKERKGGRPDWGQGPQKTSPPRFCFLGRGAGRVRGGGASPKRFAKSLFLAPRDFQAFCGKGGLRRGACADREGRGRFEARSQKTPPPYLRGPEAPNVTRRGLTAPPGGADVFSSSGRGLGNNTIRGGGPGSFHRLSGPPGG